MEIKTNICKFKVKPLKTKAVGVKAGIYLRRLLLAELLVDYATSSIQHSGFGGNDVFDRLVFGKMRLSIYL